MARPLTTLLTTWRFPVLALSLLGGFTLALFGVLLLPTGPDGLGAFAEDFKIWCFGYDPATGDLEWSYVITSVLEPVLLGAIILAVWWSPLRDGLRAHLRQLVRWSAAGLAGALAIAGLFMISIEPARADGELPFPAEELRTAQAPPRFTLIDQRGQPASLAELRGKVVLVTAVYARCGETCPMLLAQARRAVAGLTAAQRADLRVLAITLDAAHDTPAQLDGLARAQQLEPPLWRFLTGQPAEVERVLDLLDVSRRRDPETGVIQHANLFLLVDRQGRVAYRLGLGPRQERWLAVALGLLLDESG
jgi:protein SCO1/2